MDVQNQTTQTPPVSAVPNIAPKSDKSGVTWIIVGFCALFIMALFSWYLLTTREHSMMMDPQMMNNASDMPMQGGMMGDSTDTAAAAMEVQSDSDEITAIEADLEATDMSSLEEINQL